MGGNFADFTYRIGSYEFDLAQPRSSLGKRDSVERANSHVVENEEMLPESMLSQGVFELSEEKNYLSLSQYLADKNLPSIR